MTGHFFYRIADLLVSNDPYVRERAALIHVIMGHQAAGREAVLSNCIAVSNLFEGLDDQITPIRLKMAQAVESLAHFGPRESRKLVIETI